MHNQLKGIQRPIDTTSKIWDYYYKVKIPYQQSRSMQDIRAHGTNVCGIKEIDASASSEYYTTMITPAQMAEYFREGVPIRVCRYSDTEEIYEAISMHIHAWKNKLEKGINIGDAPIDDLILLDRFANVVYDKAKYQFTPEILDSILGKGLSDTLRINVHNFFNNNTFQQIPGTTTNGNGVTTINGIQEDEIPERESLGDFFKTRIINMRRF